MPPASARSKTINYPEVGIDPELFKLPQRSSSEQVTVLFAGRLVPYKLPEVVIRAFANSSILQQHKLAIVGEGPERPRLEQLIAEHNRPLAKITRTGKMPIPQELFFLVGRAEDPVQ
ncbi:glycosyltransferase [Microcoleus sp. C2C3]